VILAQYGSQWRAVMKIKKVMLIALIAPRSWPAQHMSAFNKCLQHVLKAIVKMDRLTEDKLLYSKRPKCKDYEIPITLSSTVATEFTGYILKLPIHWSRIWFYVFSPTVLTVYVKSAQCPVISKASTEDWSCDHVLTVQPVAYRRGAYKCILSIDGMESGW
jgi:hypothetical protein